MKNDETTNLIALRENQLNQHRAKGRPSAEHRLAPYRSQLRLLLASTPAPTVLELVELLGAAGVKIHRETLTKYLRREFNWKSRYERQPPQDDEPYPVTGHGKTPTTKEQDGETIKKQDKDALLESNIANLIDTLSSNSNSRGTHE